MKTPMNKGYFVVEIETDSLGHGELAALISEALKNKGYSYKRIRVSWEEKNNEQR